MYKITFFFNYWCLKKLVLFLHTISIFYFKYLCFFFLWGLCWLYFAILYLLTLTSLQTKDEACQVMPTLEEHVSNEVVKPETLDELLHSLHGFVQ